MSKILHFPAKPFPSRTNHQLHDQLDAIYDVMRFPAVKEAMDELNTLQRKYDEVFDAITRISEQVARVQIAAQEALDSLDAMNAPKARQHLHEALKCHHDE